jgi:ketosteroid isomerase-like protein
MMLQNFIAAFILIISAIVVAQPMRQNSDDTAKAVGQVMKLESRWVRAVTRRDAKALERILADDYVGTSSNGKVRNKEQTLMELRNATVGFESMTPSDFVVRVKGDMATVTGRVEVTVKLEDKLITNRFNYTRVYVHRKGRWLVTESRTTRIDE